MELDYEVRVKHLSREYNVNTMRLLVAGITRAVMTHSVDGLGIIVFKNHPDGVTLHIDGVFICNIMPVYPNPLSIEYVQRLL